MKPRLAGAFMALPLTLVLTLGGCGRSGSNEGVATADKAKSTASAGPSVAKDEQERQRQFVKCMRDNGVETGDTADAPVGGGATGSGGREQTDPAKVDAAMQKCRPFLPDGGDVTRLDAEMLESLRKQAKCMRENGVPGFPDPSADGSSVVRAGDGVDFGSPAFKAAQEKCMQLGPGVPAATAGR